MDLYPIHQQVVRMLTSLIDNECGDQKHKIQTHEVVNLITCLNNKGSDLATFVGKSFTLKTNNLDITLHIVVEDIINSS